MTHSAEAAAIADRVFTLHEGHLVEQVQQLLKSGAFEWEDISRERYQREWSAE